MVLPAGFAINDVNRWSATTKQIKGAISILSNGEDKKLQKLCIRADRGQSACSVQERQERGRERESASTSQSAEGEESFFPATESGREDRGEDGDTRAKNRDRWSWTNALFCLRRGRRTASISSSLPSRCVSSKPSLDHASCALAGALPSARTRSSAFSLRSTREKGVSSLSTTQQHPPQGAAEQYQAAKDEMPISLEERRK